MAANGSLICVGVGMTLGAHITPLCRSHIAQAEVVFSLMSDGVVALWVQAMNADVRSLQPYYQEGSSRLHSYQAMIDAILSEVRAGKRVCAAFYGHPGVFAWVPHRVIELAREAGYAAKMEPGISAEDCLYADLGIDPGRFGCAHFEASQFMFFRRRIDPSAYLVLWQIGVAGDRSLARFATSPAHRQVLVDLLAEDYALTHEIIIYRAAVLPLQLPRMERISLTALASVELDMQDTLVIPPATVMRRNESIRAQLALLDRTEINEV